VEIFVAEKQVPKVIKLFHSTPGAFEQMTCAYMSLSICTESVNRVFMNRNNACHEVFNFQHYQNHQ